MLVQPQEHIDYIALSYVWGDILRGRSASEQSQWLDTLVESCSDDSMTTLPRRIRFDRLPGTIQDAITLVESIGWKYLWVDMICIKQNDDVDKCVLIKNMDLVYEGASFTIVAAGGSNADARLPGWHHARRRPEDVCQIDTNNGRLLITLSCPPLADLVSSTIWSTRGWTFQEDLLSPCCLYFTPGEVFYSCRHHIPRSKLPSIMDYSGFGTGRYSEWREGYMLETMSIKTAYCAKSDWSNGWTRYPSRCLRSEASVIKNPDNSLLSSSFYNTISNNAKFAEYVAFVAEYTKRQLSRADDVVAAFMGILRKFPKTPCLDPGVESDGLLESHLELSLLWIAGEDIYLERRDTSDARRPQFPNWSWTGWAGAVKYPIQHLNKFDSQHSTQGMSWKFWPGKCLLVYPDASLTPNYEVRFSPKQGSLEMTTCFDFLRLAPGKIIGWLREEDYQKRLIEALAQASSMPGPINALILLTYVAEVKLICHRNSFVMRNSVFHGEISHAEVLVGCQTTGIMFDSHFAFNEAQSLASPRQYQLVVIGSGKRELSLADTQALKEWVVLLVKRRGDGEGYERVGLTTMLQSSFDVKLDWVHLV
jgi:hypothetical protein